MIQISTKKFLKRYRKHRKEQRLIYTVKENPDGTVTIDKKVYNELHRKAEAYDMIAGSVINFLKNLGEKKVENDTRMRADD